MAGKREILVCAATSQEAKAAKFGIQDSGSENTFRILHTGIGLRSAGTSLTEYLQENNHPDLIVSTGFAGAITADLPVHSWVVAQRVFSGEGEIQGINLQQLIPDVTKCVLLSLPHVFRQGTSIPNTLSALNQPLAVDMESAALAKISNRIGIPFMVLRMITDTPQEPLPELLCTLSDILLNPEPRNKVQSGILSLAEIGKDIPGLVEVIKKIGIWSSYLREGWAKYAPVIQKN